MIRILASGIWEAGHLICLRIEGNSSQTLGKTTNSKSTAWSSFIVKSRLCLPLDLSECLCLNEPRTTEGHSGNALAICRTFCHTKHCHSRGVILLHGRDSHLWKQNSIKLPFNYNEQFAKFHLAPDSRCIVQPTMHSRRSALAGSWGVEIVIRCCRCCVSVLRCILINIFDFTRLSFQRGWAWRQNKSGGETGLQTNTSRHFFVIKFSNLRLWMEIRLWQQQGGGLKT